MDVIKIAAFLIAPESKILSEALIGFGTAIISLLSKRFQKEEVILPSTTTKFSLPTRTLITTCLPPQPSLIPTPTSSINSAPSTSYNTPVPIISLTIWLSTILLVIMLMMKGGNQTKPVERSSSEDPEILPLNATLIQSEKTEAPQFPPITPYMYFQLLSAYFNIMLELKMNQTSHCTVTSQLSSDSEYSEFSLSNSPSDCSRSPSPSLYRSPISSPFISSPIGSKSVLTKPWNNWDHSAVGLYNARNDCFMLSAIQLLFHLPPMAFYLDNVVIRSSNSNGKRTITMELKELYHKYKSIRNSYVVPTAFVRRVQEIDNSMQYSQQEDASQYFYSLLNVLEKESLVEDRSMFKNLFYFMETSKRECTGCGKSKTTITKSNNITIGFPDPDYIHFKNSLQDYFHEKIEFKCDHCCSSTAVNSISLQDSPEYLFIKMNRYNCRTNNKITRLIKYPKELELSQYIVSNHPEEFNYRLVGVIEHIENIPMGQWGGGSGHYTAYAQSGDWFRYNDSKVFKVREQEALLSSNAYLLIYAKSS